MEIVLGMKGEVFSQVEEKFTAAAVGSGSLSVYATPCMAALMEEASCAAIAAGLQPDETTVGIELNLRHVSATPVGMQVRATAEVTAVEGKIITFEIHAYDSTGEIGNATHKRALVNAEKFLQRTYQKL